jgi:biotin carboxyl carrier protein
MKYYTVTVNGTTYDVAVEETTGNKNNTPNQMPIPKSSVQRESVTEKTATEKNAMEQKEIPVNLPKQNDSETLSGRLSVNAPMPGKILSIKVNKGQEVKRGEVLFVLEAMKMENEIVASEDGTIVGILVTVGENVESGDVLATLN